MEKLTMQEEEAMRWIWRIGPCFVKDVLAKYEDPKPPYTTLASVIKNLERKKYVKAKRYGNTYEYRPLIEETEYKRTFLGGVVTNYFANSYKEMVSFFAKDQKISTDDLKDIIDLIEKEKNNLNPTYHDTGICLLIEGKCSLCTLLRLLPVVLL